MPKYWKQMSKEQRKKHERKWRMFAKDLSEDIASDDLKAEARQIANAYVRSLRDEADLVVTDNERTVRQFTNTPPSEPLTDIKGAYYLHWQMAQYIWGPLLYAFVDWMWTTIEHTEVPVFLLRDAGPAYYVMKLGAAPFGRGGSRVPVSRRMLGVKDRWTGEYRWWVTPNAAQAYLVQHHVLNHRAVLIDTGAYGSVIQRLFEAFGHTAQARFIFSYNPWIPGWLNYIDVPTDFGEVIMDSLEFCTPKTIKSVSRLKRADSSNSIWKITERPTSVISRYLYGANGFGLRQAVRPQLPKGPTITDCETGEGMQAVELLLKKIHARHVEARLTGRWTGVLGTPTPKSQDQPRFMAEYPRELTDVNPIHLLPGHYPADRRKIDPGVVFGG